MTHLSRRDFLKLVRDGFLYMSAALTAGGLLRFMDYELNPAPQTEFDLGPASNYPLNSRALLSDPPAVLFHTEKGFTALSLTCTHLGCTLEPNENGFACPCHNSSFDADGKVTHGPAVKPLRSLRIEITEEGGLKLFTA